jgi:high-affinity nickel permease
MIFLSPILAAITITCLLAAPLNIVVALSCYAIGVLSLVHAKLSLFRQGVWVSFGPSRMDPQYRQSYWVGYALIGVGVLINIVALLVIRRFGRSI